MKRADPEAISKTIVIILISSLFFYMIYSMMQFGDGQSDRQASSIEKIIDKALVQCYALEGGYPTDIEYVSKYGVIFDNDKYLYYYEWYGGNLKPNVIVVEK